MLTKIIRNSKAAIKDKGGATFFLMAFVALTLFVFIMAAFETIKVFSVHYTAETNLRRLVNNAVERNIDDAKRTDGVIYLHAEQALDDFAADFHWYTGTEQTANGVVPASGTLFGTKFSETGDFLYMIDIEHIDAEPDAATMYCSGTLYIANSVPGLLERFVFALDIEIKSTNIRIEESAGLNLGAG